MKLERFISFAIICGMLGNFASANGNDTGLPASGCFATGSPGYDYIVYFEHSRPRNSTEADQSYASITPTATPQCVANMTQTLETLKPESDEDCLVLIASADYSGQQTGYDNNALSMRRLDMVEKMLKNITDNDCVEKWYAGASNADITSEYNYDSQQRAVRIIKTRKNTSVYNNIINHYTQYTSNSSSSISVLSITINPLTDPEQTIKDRIYNLAQNMTQMESGFKQSHWKTASGNFNGARFASDSIAGVVLGTAGGLITSNIIKKNQLRRGFEDIQCTIGGQIVADYDDEFNVNIH